MPLKLALDARTTPRWTFAELVAHCAQIDGVDGVGLWREGLEGLDLAQARRRLEAAGLGVSGLSAAGGFTTDYRRAMAAARRAIDQAATIGAGRVRFRSGPLVAGCTPDEAMATARRALHALAPAASEAGVSLCIEVVHPTALLTHGVHPTVADALELIDGVAGASLLLSTRHSAWNRRWADEVDQAAGRIGWFELGDSTAGLAAPVAPGAGALPLDAMLAPLVDAFDGWVDVGIEAPTYAPEDYAAVLERCVSGARRLLDAACARRAEQAASPDPDEALRAAMGAFDDSDTTPLTKTLDGLLAAARRAEPTVAEPIYRAVLEAWRARDPTGGRARWARRALDHLADLFADERLRDYLAYARDIFERTGYLKDYKSLEHYARRADAADVIGAVQPAVRDTLPDVWIKAALRRGDLDAALACWWEHEEHPRIRLCADALLEARGTDDVDLLISCRLSNVQYWIGRGGRRRYRRAARILAQLRVELDRAGAAEYWSYVIDDVVAQHTTKPALLDELAKAGFID